MASFTRSALFLLLGTLFVFALVSQTWAEEGQYEELTDDLSDLNLTPEEVANLQGDDGDEGDESSNYHASHYGGGAAAAAAIDETDVVVLAQANFSEFVESKKYALVEFYAPWCGHCKSLAPEYAKAATILKADDVALVKVDGTQNNALTEEYNIEGFPTIFFFVNGVHRAYTGGRSSDEIVKWVKKRTGPATRIIKTNSDAEVLLESEEPIAVAYLESLEGKDAEEYTAAAQQEDVVTFYVTADAEIAKKFGLEKKTPSLVVLKKQTEKVSTFDGPFERKSVGVFVTENKYPLVITFNRDTASAIFESEVKKQLLLFALPAEFERISASYEEAAKSFKSKITFVLVDLADQETAAPVLDYFSLEGEETRMLGFVAEEGGAKYMYDGDFSLDSLKTFSEKFLAKELKPYLKSEAAPEKNDEAVKVVVGDTFDEIVLDDSKDVLLEIYAPWCGHCQALEPEYNKLAEALRNVSTMVIAKMDGTKNEHSRVKIEGFPTILFFPAGKKSADPIPADTERTAVNFIKFFQAKATHSFDPPVLPEDPETPEEYDDTDEVEDGDEVEAETDEEVEGEDEVDHDTLHSEEAEPSQEAETEDVPKDEL